MHGSYVTLEVCTQYKLVCMHIKERVSQLMLLCPFLRDRSSNFGNSSLFLGKSIPPIVNHTCPIIITGEYIDVWSFKSVDILLVVCIWPLSILRSTCQQ